MSNIDKEWLQQKIADMEATRDEIPFGLDKDDSNTLAAMKLALASLEAEAVAFRSKLKPPYAGSERWDYTDHRQPDAFELENCFIERLYTAPPAPVSVPDAMEMDDDFDSAFEHGKAVGWNACRAAILQGAEPVQGWIPCSDRMPTKNDRVLIFINFNSDTVPPSIHDAQFTGSTFRRGNATVNVFPLEDGYGVTHWMPLPAAPQQGA
ncbi:DUF551 domain-containing protein [Enterobacter roggenkampii]|uniref:DUF551 domain-containing protein n=1 Tax=Enterobacter roggenkampii TaxID=1812935 RepID=UPI001D089290|nr:DUF551 domain-containing protein [Enterobacter roggenkampii]MCB7504527.1 DUF551 domain-containing protein [Enterobacter roggenkampii]